MDNSPIKKKNLKARIKSHFSFLFPSSLCPSPFVVNIFCHFYPVFFMEIWTNANIFIFPILPKSYTKDGTLNILFFLWVFFHLTVYPCDLSITVHKKLLDFFYSSKIFHLCVYHSYLIGHLLMASWAISSLVDNFLRSTTQIYTHTSSMPGSFYSTSSGSETAESKDNTFVILIDNDKLPITTIVGICKTCQKCIPMPVLL